MEDITELPDKRALLREIYGTDNARKAFDLSIDRSVQVRNEQMAGPLEMHSKMKLPYHAPGESLPQPLPTVQDIEKAKHTGNIGLRLLGSPYEVYRVNDVFVVKFSDSASVVKEAENMLFLEQNQPQLRIPKLYAAFSHQGGNPRGLWCAKSRLPTYYYVVMEYIPGLSLSMESWYETSLEFKKGMLKKISYQLHLLRSIPPPEPHYYGRIHNQPWSRRFPAFRSPRRNGPNGPYHSKEEFIDALFESTMQRCLTNNREDSWSPPYELGLKYFRQTLSRFEGWESKMTHLDLKTENIMFRRVDKEAKKSDTPFSKLKAEDFEVVLIDWTDACWMPAWVEAANMSQRSPVTRGCIWMSEISKGLEKFHFVEVGLFKHLRSWTFLTIF